MVAIGAVLAQCGCDTFQESEELAGFQPDIGAEIVALVEPGLDALRLADYDALTVAFSTMRDLQSPDVWRERFACMRMFM